MYYDRKKYTLFLCFAACVKKYSHAKKRNNKIYFYNFLPLIIFVCLMQFTIVGISIINILFTPLEPLLIKRSYKLY